MKNGADYFLKKTLGDDFFESLQKFDLYKIGTRSVVDPEEIKIALQIVPRTIIALLIKELIPMNIGDTKEIPLFVASDAIMSVTKHERDCFSGKIEQGNQKIAEFNLRSLPGVGLIIMTAFELYDMENLINSPFPAENNLVDGEKEDSTYKIQKLIDERLALHDLVHKVVDKKIAEKEAIHKLIMSKLTETVIRHREEPRVEVKVQENKEPAQLPLATMKHGLEVNDNIVEGNSPKPSKGSPLKDFLDKKKSKVKKNEFFVAIQKNERVECPDCRKEIFNGSLYSGCICLGENMDSKIYIKKSENGIKIRFPKSWDVENIELLLQVLRKQNG